MSAIVNLESEDQLLVFYSTPNTLLNMAASELAFHFWSHEICKILADEDILKYEFTFSINDILKVFVPESIKILVDYHIEAAKSELKSWIRFHQCRIFDIYRTDVILKCLDCIVLGAQGGIIYKKTAENLLSSNRLNSVEKYRVACVYCFKEHIDCLWPSVSFARCCDDGTIMGNWGCSETHNFSPFQSVNYWNRIQKNQSIDGSPIFVVNDMHTSSKLEYFCKNMTQDELDQLSYYATNENHDNPGRCFRTYDYIKFLLPKVGIVYQRNILEKCAAHILLVLAEGDDEVRRTALQVWHHVKHSISSKDFYFILETLWTETFDNYLCVYYRHKPTMLHEIWTSASNHLRNNISNTQLIHLFTRIRIGSKMRNYGQDFGFVWSILSGMEIQFRRKVWLNHWRKFICLAKLSDLYELMKLCLSDEDSIGHFIKYYMTNCTLLKWEFISFIEAGLCQELMQYLKFFSPDESSAKETQREILYSLKNDGNFFIRDFSFNWSRCMKLNAFIVNAFPSDAQQFKIDFIQNNLNFWTLLLIRGTHLNDIRNLIDCLLSYEQTYSVQVKRYFFQCCQLTLGGLFVRFNRHDWQSFLKWCAPSEEELSKFKKSLPLNDVFTTLLTRAIKGQKYLRMRTCNTFYVDYSEISYPTLSALNNFLLWYFGSEYAVNKFKLSIIENCENVGAIKTVLNEDSSFFVIMDLLKWFFNHDLEKALQFYCKFKSTNLQQSREIAVIRI